MVSHNERFKNKEYDFLPEKNNKPDHLILKLSKQPIDEVIVATSIWVSYFPVTIKS